MFFGYCFLQLIGTTQGVSDIQFLVTAICCLVELNYEIDLVKVLRTGQHTPGPFNDTLEEYEDQ